MRSLFCFVTVGILTLATTGYAQDSKKEPTTKAMFMVTGLHCAPCAATVEGSLRRIKGVGSIKVDFNGKNAVIAFDENMISAQEVARAISSTPHMMGRDMQYDGVLVLSVPGVKNTATATKAKAALSKVAGVANVTLEVADATTFDARGVSVIITNPPEVLAVNSQHYTSELARPPSAASVVVGYVHRSVGQFRHGNERIPGPNLDRLAQVNPAAITDDASRQQAEPFARGGGDPDYGDLPTSRDGNEG